MGISHPFPAQVLADRFGYTKTFLITIGLQASGMLFYAQLLGIVQKEADLAKKAKRSPLDDAATGDLDAPLLGGREGPPEESTSIQ